MSQSVTRMAQPSKYSIENFDPQPDDELICSICRCVFQDPAECSCRHVFCRSCITSWLAVQKSCPICRKKTYASDLQPVVPIIRNMIQKLRLFCPNAQQGCTEKTTLEGYDGHVKVCPYELVKCKNAQCKELYIRKEVARHEEQECKHRLVQCQSSCGLMLPLSLRKSHSCMAELKKYIADNQKEMARLQSKLEKQEAELKRLENELQKLRSRNSQEQNSADDDSSDFTYDFHDSDDSCLSDDSIDFSAGTDISAGTDTDPSELSTQSDHRPTDDDETTAQHSDDSMFQSFTSSSYSSAVSFDGARSTSGENNSEVGNDTLSSPLHNDNDSSYFREVSLSNESLTDSIDPSTPHTSRGVPRTESLLQNMTLNSEKTSEESDVSANSGVASDNRPGGSDAAAIFRKSRVLKRKTTLPIVSNSSDSTSENEMQPENSKSKERRVDHVEPESSKPSSAMPKNVHAATQPASASNSNAEGSIVNLTDGGPSNRNQGNKQKGTKTRPTPKNEKSQNQASKKGTKRSGKGSSSKMTAPASAATSASTAVNSLQSSAVAEASGSQHTVAAGQTASQDATGSARTSQNVQEATNQRPRRSCRMPGRYNSGSTRGRSRTAGGLPRTASLLEKFSMDSDPDWIPPENPSDGTDRGFNELNITISTETISDTSSEATSSDLESSSSYEVRVPERTWDKMIRYANVPSEDDEEWVPGVEEFLDI